MAGKLGEGVNKWWAASKAGFQSESFSSAVERTVQGLPVTAAAFGAFRAAKGAEKALPALQRIHSAETLTKGSAKYGTESVRKMSTESIVKSLRPGSAEPLKVKSDGRIFDGNTRIFVLEERGYDVNSLPRVIIP